MYNEPVKIIETKTDTVWVTKVNRDTITVTKEVVTTDTVFVEKVIRVVDTVFNDVIKTVTVTEVDTVYVTRNEIAENQIRLIHPGSHSETGFQFWKESVDTWFSYADKYNMKPKARTIIFTPVYWGWPTDGMYIYPYVYDEKIVEVVMEYRDAAIIWRALSNILLDIPILEPPEGTFTGEDGIEYGYYYYNLFWYDNGVSVKPEYDHLMFRFFETASFLAATPEKQEWYWKEMFGVE
jgi:hypothetical protein